MDRQLPVGASARLAGSITGLVTCKPESVPMLLLWGIEICLPRNLAESRGCTALPAESCKIINFPERPHRRVLDPYLKEAHRIRRHFIIRRRFMISWYSFYYSDGIQQLFNDTEVFSGTIPRAAGSIIADIWFLPMQSRYISMVA